MSTEPTRVLFVCLGNICRSPSAEAVFRARVAAAGLSDAFDIDSAGTIDYHAGDPADRRMRQHASQRGYDLTSISRGIQAEDFERFDVIVGMDNQNLSDLNERAADCSGRQKIVRMTDYCRRFDDAEVPDPYFGGAAGFEHVLDLLEDACDGLLAELRPES